MFKKFVCVLSERELGEGGVFIWMVWEGFIIVQYVSVVGRRIGQQDLLKGVQHTCACNLTWLT
jgi:hypothetical protein